MKHRTNAEKRAERMRAELSDDLKNYQDSKPEHRDLKAYKKCKTPPTDYGSGRKCSYGEKNKTCDPGCIFWNTCIKGRRREEAIV